MSKITALPDNKYQAVAEKLTAKGLTPAEAGELIASADFVISFEDTKYRVYLKHLMKRLHTLAENPANKTAAFEI